MIKIAPSHHLAASTILSVCLGLTTACATLPGDPGPDIRAPGPENGYIPDSIGIIQPGRAYVETSVEAAEGPDDASSRRFPILVRTGLGKNVEARAVIGAYRHDESASGSSFGSGPFSLGIKYRFSEGGGNFATPAWGLQADLAFSGFFDENHDSAIVSGATLNFDHTLSSKTLFTWNVGILVPKDAVDGYFAQGFFTAAFAAFVSRDVQLYVDTAINAPSDGSGSDPSALLGLGGYVYLGNRTVIWAGYDIGLTSVSPDGTAKLGVSFAF